MFYAVAKSNTFQSPRSKTAKVIMKNASLQEKHCLLVDKDPLVPIIVSLSVDAFLSRLESLVRFMRTADSKLLSST